MSACRFLCLHVFDLPSRFVALLFVCAAFVDKVVLPSNRLGLACCHTHICRPLLWSCFMLSWFINRAGAPAAQKHFESLLTRCTEKD